MTDLARLAPRSAGAVADTELLRVARTDLDEAETAAHLTIADRIRGLAALRPIRSPDVASVPVRLDGSRD
ncbi:MAG TPA: hypothetical protein VKB30_01600 [Candidatus Limnocylindrales bacterium]|nr:hypothetical protein [Candidatus Limnocylindrales bacterium]